MHHRRLCVDGGRDSARFLVTVYSEFHDRWFDVDSPARAELAAVGVDRLILYLGPPFDITRQVMAHIVVTMIYGFMLTTNVKLFAMWQKRPVAALQGFRAILPPSCATANAARRNSAQTRKKIFMLKNHRELLFDPAQCWR